MRRVLIALFVAACASAPAASAARYQPYANVDPESGRVIVGVRDAGTNSSVVVVGVDANDPNACFSVGTGWPVCVLP